MDAPEKEKLVLKRSILGLGKKIFVMRNDYLNRKKKKKKRKKKGCEILRHKISACFEY